MIKDWIPKSERSDHTVYMWSPNKKIFISVNGPIFWFHVQIGPVSLSYDKES
jgi:hypothetical protein